MAQLHEKLRRAPVLMPGRYAGVEISQGRAVKIELVDGALVVHDHAGTRTAAQPHEITKAIVLDKGQATRWFDKSELAGPAQLIEGPLQVFALLAGLRPVLVVRLNEFTPHPPSGLVRVGDPEVRLRNQSGVSSLCRDLGLPIEGPTAEEIAAVNGPQGRAAAVLLTDPSLRGPRYAPLIAALGIVAAFAAWPQGFSVVTAAISVVAAALVAPLVWRTFRGRRLFLKVADSEEHVASGARFVADHPPTRGLQDAWLVLSAERVVFHARGLEITAAGPALGGVVTCEVWEELVYFNDADGEGLISLSRPCFFGSDEDLDKLVKVCSELGVKYGKYFGLAASLPGEAPQDGDEELNVARKKQYTGLVPFSWQAGGRGSITPWFTWLVTMMQFATGFGLFVVHEQLWAVPFFVVYTTMFGMATYSSVALARWSSKQRRKVRRVLARG